jgi:hypothetical protein
MRRTSLYLCLITAFLLVMACVQKTPEPAKTTEEESAPSIQGVWTFEQMETVGGPNEGTAVPQAALAVFTKKYYSSVRDTAAKPRPLWKSNSPSEKEILATSDGFDADSGTYEFDGSTLVIYPSVANMPNYMSGGKVSFDCQLEGENLTLIWRPGSSVIPGTELTPVEFTEMRYKLKRLE